MSEALYLHQAPFLLESGDCLPAFQLAYTTLGRLNAQRNNVVWICHALTANSHPEEWWPGLVGEGKLFDPMQHFIVCANMLGSCYGSTYALSVDPETGQPWYHRFPMISNRDIARAFDLLRKHLGLDRIQLLIGGSLGGQQLLEWAVMQPGVFDRIVPLATNARHSPWGIAFNESQRMAIAADATWSQDHPEAGKAGLRAARSMALISYRSYDAYRLSQTDLRSDALEGFRATTYQQYQGDKLVKRFDAFAYWTLSKAMDSHHLARGRGSLEEVLSQISAKTLVIAVDSDGLFPPVEQRFLAENIPDAQYLEVTSAYGHDGFLIEFEAIEAGITQWMGSR